MKIYQVVRQSSLLAENMILLTTTDSAKALTEFLDLVHEAACANWDMDFPDFFLSEKYNDFASLDHINQWEQCAEANRFAQWYDGVDGAYYRIAFTVVEVKR